MWGVECERGSRVARPKAEIKQAYKKQAMKLGAQVAAWGFAS